MSRRFPPDCDLFSYPAPNICSWLSTDVNWHWLYAMFTDFGGKHEVIVDVTGMLSGSGCNVELITAIDAQISGSAAVYDSVHAIAGTPGYVPRPSRNFTNQVAVGGSVFLAARRHGTC